MVSLWFAGFLPPPQSDCIQHSSHHVPPYYNDAAPPEEVMALFIANSPSPCRGPARHSDSQLGTNFPDERTISALLETVVRELGRSVAGWWQRDPPARPPSHRPPPPAAPSTWPGSMNR